MEIRKVAKTTGRRQKFNFTPLLMHTDAQANLHC